MSDAEPITVSCAFSIFSASSFGDAFGLFLRISAAMSSFRDFTALSSLAYLPPKLTSPEICGGLRDVDVRGLLRVDVRLLLVRGVAADHAQLRGTGSRRTAAALVRRLQVLGELLGVGEVRLQVRLRIVGVVRVEQPPAAAAAAPDVASAQRGTAAPVLQPRDVRADARGHAATRAGDPLQHHGPVGPLHHLDLLGAGDLDEQDLHHDGVLGLLRGEQALGGLEGVTAGRQRVVGAGGALGVVPAAPVRADDPLHLAHDPVVDIRAEGGARDGQDDGAGHRDHAQVLHGPLAAVPSGAAARALPSRPADPHAVPSRSSSPRPVP
ncbi:hypothetical protein [Streptomyces geysiriensis]|uniref:hypothetical protein n=1 Tax=Streptomyces geysiriensis TaxID=68207 RepID=UPI001C7DD90C|nr:hypothetical protein [Streptomyces geysiriensis]MBX4179312.1 hypothetical protein [Streptomyces geysiriensis]